MTRQLNRRDGVELLREIDFVDKETLELKKEIQHKGCPFCEVDDGEFIENYQTRQAIFYKFKKCNRCLLIYPYPRPNQKALESFFETKEYTQDSQERFETLEEKEERREKLEEKNPFFIRKLRERWRKCRLFYSYQEFKRFAKKGYKILDVGAGHGEVAAQLIEKGCIVEAVEMDPYRAQYLRTRLGIKVYHSKFEETPLEDSTYDMVIFSQVLMHLFSTKRTIEKVRRLLKPGGLIVTSQMNFNSILQQTIRSPYPGKGLSAFNIVSWFTPESLRMILEKSGFEIVDTMFRPSGLLGYIFTEGYPGGVVSKAILKAIDQILKVILMKTGTTDYFAVIARKR